MNTKPVPIKLVAAALTSNVSPLYELYRISYKLPRNVLTDVNQRIGDWLASGGNDTDPYIKQQVAYAKKVYKTLKGDE
jgi:hypothetical protein